MCGVIRVHDCRHDALVPDHNGLSLAKDPGEGRKSRVLSKIFVMFLTVKLTTSDSLLIPPSKMAGRCKGLRPVQRQFSLLGTTVATTFIDDVTVSDGGRYECQVSVSKGVMRRVVELSVVGEWQGE